MFNILFTSYKAEYSYFVTKTFCYHVFFTIKALLIANNGNSFFPKFVFIFLVFINSNIYFGYIKKNFKYFI